jgi:hypothetical protein
MVQAFYIEENLILQYFLKIHLSLIINKYIFTNGNDEKGVHDLLLTCTHLHLLYAIKQICVYK